MQKLWDQTRNTSPPLVYSQPIRATSSSRILQQDLVAATIFDFVQETRWAVYGADVGTVWPQPLQDHLIASPQKEITIQRFCNTLKGQEVPFFALIDTVGEGITSESDWEALNEISQIQNRGDQLLIFIRKPPNFNAVVDYLSQEFSAQRLPYAQPKYFMCPVVGPTLFHPLYVCIIPKFWVKAAEMDKIFVETFCTEEANPAEEVDRTCAVFASEIKHHDSKAPSALQKAIDAYVNSTRMYKANALAVFFMDEIGDRLIKNHGYKIVAKFAKEDIQTTKRKKGSGGIGKLAYRSPVLSAAQDGNLARPAKGKFSCHLSGKVARPLTDKNVSEFLEGVFPKAQIPLTAEYQKLLEEREEGVVAAQIYVIVAEKQKDSLPVEMRPSNMTPSLFDRGEKEGGRVSKRSRSDWCDCLIF
jgi:hypothetical protein